MNSTTRTDNEALLGAPVTLTFQHLKTGELRHAEMRLKAFRVREYPELMPKFMEETTLIERALGVAAGAVFDRPDEEITPESYELLAATLRRVCHGFFAYAGRQMELVNKLPGRLVNAALSSALPGTSRG